MSQENTGSAQHQAAIWLARLRGSQVTRVQRQEFSRWLEASSAHQAAFDELLELWESLAILRHYPIEKLALPGVRTRGPAPVAARRTGWVLAANLAIFLSLLFFNFRELPLELDTSPGEIKSATLEDGSVVRLNTGSDVEVSLGAAMREVVLRQGEIFIEVAKDPERPLRVRTRHGVVTAIGTAFGVRTNKKQTQVFVAEGIVAASAHVAPDRSLDHLSAGLALEFDETGVGLPTHSAENELSWLGGQLIYSDVTLSALIQDLNRYMPAPMRLSAELQRVDPRVSAVLKIADQESTLQALETLLGVRWRRDANGQIELYSGPVAAESATSAAS